MSTDNLEIRSEADYQNVLATLSRRDRPHAILRFLMRALESYRAARKMGWSRPWNKYGVVNFQSFKLDPAQDHELLALGQAVLDAECAAMPAPARAFVDDLFARRDPLMGFVFIQEFTDGGCRFEGGVLSLGRRATDQPRYRDRLDLILESPVVEGHSQGLARLRVFVDPYLGKKEPLWSTTVEPAHDAASVHLFERLATLSWDWPRLPERLWDHWTSAYIDYFGPRQWLMRKSYFHVATAPWARIDPAASATPRELFDMESSAP
ncbi:MAG: hypothetical protein P9F19_06820 [Candidatus Contendobacter sp.]|nr:hypothetical protein [Candidatus Contendobacter sp.]MDG4557083.1 hypothetical protein [Candidatus Contendobacter sp.]